jgi:hypothetical protein
MSKKDVSWFFSIEWSRFVLGVCWTKGTTDHWLTFYLGPVALQIHLRQQRGIA